MTINLKFCGAAGTVTGSCYWYRHPGGQFLVDCGMFQGSKTLKQLNYGAFPFDPSKIDFVLLTHAHIDHSGLIPKLIKQGFKGPVYTTRETIDLLSFMWPDSGYIHETEVAFLNRRNAMRGRAPVEPIYNRADATAALDCLRPVAFEGWVEAGKGVRARYWNAGHILGAASVEVEITSEEETTRILMSGDIGPDNKLFYRDPEGPSNLDYVVCEGTYGGRTRQMVDHDARQEIFAREITDALDTTGILIIPSFAVERTQELLADMVVLMERGDIPSVPVFLDSPLAIRATEVFSHYSSSFEDVPNKENLFTRPNFHFTESVDESKAIARYKSGVIILAASGMCEAGRIRHHLKNNLWRDKATVLLVGYQAEGTLGALLAEGKRAVRIMGEDIHVKARIRQIDVYSGHADGRELVQWVLERLPIKKGLFLTHGNEAGLNALRDDLIAAGVSDKLAFIPKLDDEVNLSAKTVRAEPRPALRRLSAEAVSHPDWHNELAQLSLDLRDALEAAADERARGVILRRMRRALQGDGRPIKPAPDRARRPR